MTRIVWLLILTAFLIPISGGPAMAAKEGQELIGSAAPAFSGLAWVGGKPLTMAGLRGKTVLVRFWTDGCPYCANTAPALNELSHCYGDQGLVVIGVYHPKPPAPRTEAYVADAARRLGFTFPVAIDAKWETLRRWWVDRIESRWTSVSFLIDRRGVVRFIHPGGEYYPGDGAPGRDYEALRAAIERLLAEPNGRNRG